MSTGPIDTERRQRQFFAAGVITWMVVGVPVLVTIVREPGVLAQGAVGGWIGAYAVFGAAFWLSARRQRWPVVGLRALVIAQSVSALAANWLIPLPVPGIPLGSVLLVIAAARTPEVFPARVALVVVAAQTVGLLAAFRAHWPWTPSIITAAAFGVFQLFACFASLLARSEAEARRELAASLASLRATQAMLAQNAAIAERSRIDRELHDVLGHHLVLLSLNLQTAAGLCTGRAAELVRGAHGLTRLILSDLRTMVREGAGAESVDLRDAVERLAASVPGLQVRASVADDVGPLEPAVAHAVFRCVQEFLTNTLKHAAADEAGVEVSRVNGTLRLEAWDNGRGSGARTAAGDAVGGGLVGMRERLAELGGEMEVRTSPGAGFRVIATVPSARVGQGGPA